jgi:signal transduction histidine kinase
MTPAGGLPLLRGRLRRVAGTWMTPVLAQTDAVSAIDRSRLPLRWRRARNLIILVIVTVAMFQDEPRPELTSGRGLALIAGLVVGGAAWAAMGVRRLPPGPQLIAICAAMAAGLLLTAVAGASTAPVYVIAALTSSAATLSLTTTAVLTGAGLIGLIAVLATHHVPAAGIAIWCGAAVLVALLTLLRRQREASAEQERLLDAEQDRVAALAERARLAREIHDVLAHSLAALSVQLETAAALLERDRAAEAAVLVDRAGTMAREGLTETRRAVSALRGDPLPIPELVGELTAGYGRDLDAPATFTVDGEPRELEAETGLALFRAAQEALANVRKHAPGSAVEARLTFAPDAVALSVRNHGPAGAPLTGLSSGYGLIGLRERAELAGGRAEAGPDRDGWLVDIRMPG